MNDKLAIKASNARFDKDNLILECREIIFMTITSPPEKIVEQLDQTKLNTN